MSEQPGEQDDRYARTDASGEGASAEPRPVTPDLPPPDELAGTSLDVPVGTESAGPESVEAESTGQPAEDLDPDGPAPEPPA
jgi:hypothetical protein